MMEETMQWTTPRGVHFNIDGTLSYSTTYLAKMFDVRTRKFFAMLTLLDCIFYERNQFKPAPEMFENNFCVRDELLLYHSSDGEPFKVVRYWWTVDGCKFLERLLKKHFKVKLKEKFYEQRA